MTEEFILDVIENLNQIEIDDSVPKNVKNKIRMAINALQEEKELKIRANKALQHLDEVSNDPNVPSYVRPQVWNIVSLLESL